MQHSSSDRDFSGYNAAQAQRGVRPLAIAAVDAAGPSVGGVPRTAVELGCGRGIEARFLAENGYTVHAYDADPSVSEVLAELAAEQPVLPTAADLAEITSLPDADLLLSCATLPFIPRESFERLWSLMMEVLLPGGILAVDLFGVHDDWAGTDGTFLSRHEVDALLAGLEVLDLVEEERDGRSFSGPKHWHTFRILARRS